MNVRPLHLVVLLIGIALTMTTIAFGQVPGSGVQYNHECIGYQICRWEPACPTGTGECDSCTRYNASHEHCVMQTGFNCQALAFEDGGLNEDQQEVGCGFRRDGICDANDLCSWIPDPNPPACPREDCKNV
ncbi:MAG: hypothetical protein ACR2GY_00440 [Phycisphaerales bacterium]